MPSLINKSERLVTTHMGETLPPGVATEVSAETMQHPQIQEWVTAGSLEVAADNPVATKAAPTAPATTANTKA